MIDIAQLKQDSASFDPASPGSYQRINTDVGPLIVSLGSIEPYLDGYKVQLKVGNPLSVTFNGFVVRARWGPRYEKGQDYAAGQAATQEKNTSRVEKLIPGSFASVDIILPSTVAKNVGFLSVGISVDQLSVARSIQ